MKRHDPEARQEFGELHTLLKRVFPEYRTNRDRVFDVPRLASAMSMTEEAVYRWLRADKLPTRRAKQILKLANTGRKQPVTTIEDFLPFID